MTAPRPAMGKWRCKDCKAEFATYEATAGHVRTTHGREPRSAAVAEVLHELDALEEMIKRAARRANP